MEFFFADDSSQDSKRSGMGKVIGFGGLFIDEQNLRDLDTELKKITNNYGIPQDEEIKWSPKRGSWLYKNLHGDERRECYKEILEAAKNFDCRAIVVAWDTGRTTLKGDAAFEKVFDFTVERISVHLDKRSSLGTIVADKPGGGKKEDEKFIEAFLNKIFSGTPYVTPENIPINILTTPSHLETHLQIADLISSITVAMVSGQDRYAKHLFPTIKDMMVKNHLGFIGGTGLKLFPDSLTNLYYWLLGEDCFSKVSISSGIGLHSNRYDYFEDQGITN